MDIVIRNLDPVAVKTIDEKAKKLSLSRNAYLIQILENIATKDLLHDEKNDMQEGYRKMTTLLEILVNQSKEKSKQLQKTLLALSIMSDVEYTVFDKILEGAIGNEESK